MMKDCAKYKDELLEAALTGKPGGALEAHLKECADCGMELKALLARRGQLDALLPLVTRGAEPSPEFRARVMAAAEAATEQKSARTWRVWAYAGASAVITTVLISGWMFEQSRSRLAGKDEIAAAEKLTEWRAPSDVLLATPGNEILRTTPKLGESYLKAAATKNQEQ